MKTKMEGWGMHDKGKRKWIAKNYFVITKDWFELRALRPQEQSQANPFHSQTPSLEPEASKMGPTETLSNNIARKLQSLCVPQNLKV